MNALIEIRENFDYQKSCPKCLRIMKILYFDNDPVGYKCEFCEFFLERKDGGNKKTNE